MKLKFTAVVLGLLVVLAAAQDCPVDKKPELVSGAVGLNSQSNSDTNAQNLVYNYQFSDSFATTPNVAIGLNEIQAKQSPYLEIQISAARVTEHDIYFQAKSGELSQWKSFQVNFLASSRNDLEVGSAMINRPIAKSDGTFQVGYDIQQDFSRSGLRVKSFLQGINIQSLDNNTIGVRQQTTNVVGKRVFFSFASPERRSIVRQIHLSIVVFNMYTPGVLYADGIIDQNYVQSTTKITIPKHGINELRTYIVGINCFETSATHPLSISSAIDETFTLVIGPIDRNQIDFISVSYLILSIIDCGSCAGFPLLYDGLCVLNCPSGTRPNNGQCIPIVCDDGFKLDENDKCVPICAKNEELVNERCVCKEGFNRINQVCDVCKEGEYFDFRDAACKPLCTFNSFYENGRCFCNEGYSIINGLCQKCPYGSLYNAVTQKCDDICTNPFQVYSPEGCVCMNGYHNISGICGRCPYQRVFNPISSQCECLNGFEPVSGDCKPVCGMNETRRSDGYCDCSPNYFRMYSGRCELCPEHSFYDRIKAECICPSPYMMMNGLCVPVCPRNHYFNETVKKCLPHCKLYLEDYVNGECVCTKYHERIGEICVASCLALQVRVNGVCECIAGFTKNVIGQCVAINCPAGSRWNATLKDCVSICHPLQVFINNECVCQAGYKSDNRYGDCIPVCTQFEVRGDDGYCKCPDNFIRFGLGICVPDCPPGSVGYGGKCVCHDNCKEWGFNGYSKSCSGGLDYDPVTDSCRCDKPKIRALSGCIKPNPCGTNQYWCGTHCVCNYGFYMVNGACVPVTPALTCPANSVSNGVNCQCLPGFFPVTSSSCQRCPTGSFWNGKICQVGQNCLPGYKWDVPSQSCILAIPLCSQNERWDGVTCRCAQGFHLINGACRQCPYGTVFDGISCVAGTGLQCLDPYAFYNGFACVCIPGFWPLVNGMCITCPSGTTWDGTCCKTRIGVMLPLVVP